MNNLNKYAIIILAGIFLTFAWMLPVVFGGIVVGWLARGRSEPLIQKLKQAYEDVNNES